jgi:hypothetical protein
MPDKNPTQSDLFKAIADVLDEALGEYDALKKSAGVMPADDQSTALATAPGASVVGPDGKPPAAEGIDNAVEVPDPSKPASPAPAPVASPVAQAPGIDAAKPAEMGASGEPEKKKDEEMMEMHKSLTAKLIEKGLLKKSDTEVTTPVETSSTLAKSELVKFEEELRKAVDAKMDTIGAAVRETSDLVKRIAAQPMPRRGAAGYSPLAKSDIGAGTPAPAPLKKSEMVDKLLDLKQKGDRRVDTGLINRLETGRLTKSDGENIKNLGILG